MTQRVFWAFIIAACLFPSSTVFAQSAELEAYWAFDDAAGSSIGQDGTTNNRDVSINTAGGGSAGIVTGGRFGNTLIVNNNTGTFAEADGPAGSNSYQGVTGMAARSVSAWIRPAGGAQDDAIISWGTNTSEQKWTVRTENDGNQLRAEFANGGVEHSAAPPNIYDGGWHHVAATLPAGGNGASVTLYIDGVAASIDMTNTSNPLNTVAGALVRVGLDLSNRAFDGEIDDVGIFSRAMTDNEIAAIYNLAQEASLNYDLGDADAVLDVFNNGGEAEIGDLIWRQTSSLSQTEGDVVAVGDGFSLQLDASGNGVIGAPAVVPEPASIVIWSLIGLGLAGFGYYRNRRK